MPVDIARFVAAFDSAYPHASYTVPDESLFSPFVTLPLDPCPDIEGMLSLRKQQLLHLAYGLLPPGEAYLEVGTYHGKSLISAVLGNDRRTTYAADNFSEFDVNSLEILMANLARYGVADVATFFDADFRTIYTPEHLREPVGLYFFDGPHDEPSQHDAIRMVEPFLADYALVLVDDWRFASDSMSYAKAGTRRAIAASRNRWKLLYELPARCNGDRALWWNGVAVLSFERCP